MKAYSKNLFFFIDSVENKILLFLNNFPKIETVICSIQWNMLSEVVQGQFTHIGECSIDFCDNQLP